jgi:hypothetical protein
MSETLETELFRSFIAGEEGFYKIITWWKDYRLFYNFRDEEQLQDAITNAEGAIVVMLRRGHSLQQLYDMYQKLLDQTALKPRQFVDKKEVQSFFQLIVCLKKLKFVGTYGWKRVTKKDYSMEYENPGRVGLVLVDENNLIYDAITEINIGVYNAHKEEFHFADRPTKCNWCANCKAKISKKKCPCCRNVYYCSEECQKTDWKKHREECVDIADDTSGGKWVPCGVCDMPPAFCLCIEK